MYFADRLFQFADRQLQLVNRLLLLASRLLRRAGRLLQRPFVLRPVAIVFIGALNDIRGIGRGGALFGGIRVGRVVGFMGVAMLMLNLHLHWAGTRCRIYGSGDAYAKSALALGWDALSD